MRKNESAPISRLTQHAYQYIMVVLYHNQRGHGMTSLRLAVLGAGFWAKFQIPAISQIVTRLFRSSRPPTEDA